MEFIKIKNEYDRKFSAEYYQEFKAETNFNKEYICKYRYSYYFCIYFYILLLQNNFRTDKSKEIFK